MWYVVTTLMLRHSICLKINWNFKITVGCIHEKLLLFLNKWLISSDSIYVPSDQNTFLFQVNIWFNSMYLHTFKNRPQSSWEKICAWQFDILVVSTFSVICICQGLLSWNGKKYRAYILVRGVINQGTEYGHTVSFLFIMSQIFRVIFGQIGKILLRGNWFFL